MRRFVVIGLGRFGQKLAIALTMSGAEVIAIDKERDQVEVIRDQVAHAVRLDSTDMEALKSQRSTKWMWHVVGIGQGTARASKRRSLPSSTSARWGSADLCPGRESRCRRGLLQGWRHRRNLSGDRVGPTLGLQTHRPADREKIDFAPGYSIARIEAPPVSMARASWTCSFARNTTPISCSSNATARMGRQGGSEPHHQCPHARDRVHEGDILMVAGADADLVRLPQE